jgi:transposase InsO family protein
MPVLRQAATRPSLQASHHTTKLALCLLGARHDWATANCARWFQQSIGGHRQFTKWVEVKPVTCPKADRVLDFLDELVHRYGLPHCIITDLGSNFNDHQFREYCENSGIDVRYISVAHPRANGQVERANGMVLDALKKRLHDAANSKAGKWIKELPNALWGLRTQPSKPTGQSPYFLVYGSEVILPADVIWNSPAVEHYDEGVSEDSR